MRLPPMGTGPAGGYNGRRRTGPQRRQAHRQQGEMLVAIKVMLVDDDREFGEELAALLQHAGYEVATFVDGVSAFNDMQRVKPDVVVLDLKMENCSGQQVAWYLRLFQGTATIPLIGISGFAHDGDARQMASACGMDDFLKKPFAPAELMARIERLAGIHPAETAPAKTTAPASA